MMRLAFSAGLSAMLFTLNLATAARGSDDIRDLPYVLDVVNDALETARTNVEVPWKNPTTGNGGVIVVEKTFYPSPETPCREYRRTLDQPGAGARMTRGTGCRVGPGRWKIEEERTSSTLPKATESGPGSGGTGSPPPPGSREAGARPPAPKTLVPPKTDERPAKTPPSSSTATKAEPKPHPPPALPEFTMPSKAEI